MEKRRNLYFIESYFREFCRSLAGSTQKKIFWVLDIVQCQERIPEVYFKHLTGTSGLYEIRVQSGGSSFRIFCFFDNNTLVIGHAFQKKTDKTPQKEIARAEKIKKEYYEKNAANKS